MAMAMFVVRDLSVRLRIISPCYDMPQRGHGARSRKLEKGEEKICRETGKMQWWIEVAARYGRGEGGALSDVQGDF